MLYRRPHSPAAFVTVLASSLLAVGLLALLAVSLAPGVAHQSQTTADPRGYDRGATSAWPRLQARAVVDSSGSATGNFVVFDSVSHHIPQPEATSLAVVGATETPVADTSGWAADLWWLFVAVFSAIFAGTTFVVVSAIRSRPERRVGALSTPEQQQETTADEQRHAQQQDSQRKSKRLARHAF
jgi:hypothetical protein